MARSERDRCTLRTTDPLDLVLDPTCVRRGTGVWAVDGPPSVPPPAGGQDLSHPPAAGHHSARPAGGGGGGGGIPRPPG
ncbi:MAG: hypothetical protein ACYC1C_20005, partial [Chloroflexota bacterium]